jgi:dihydroxyacid dehydratase/phosphogluconate dehydratase
MARKSYQDLRSAKWFVPPDKSGHTHRERIKQGGCSARDFAGQPALAENGIRDMVRISDARVSGTHYGTVVLHVTPESAAGGRPALVQNGDIIELDADEWSLNLLASAEELDRRRVNRTPPLSRTNEVGPRLYTDHIVLPATERASTPSRSFLDG